MSSEMITVTFQYTKGKYLKEVLRPVFEKRPDLLKLMLEGDHISIEFATPTAFDILIGLVHGDEFYSDDTIIKSWVAQLNVHLGVLPVVQAALKKHTMHESERLGKRIESDSLPPPGVQTDTCDDPK